MEKGKFQIEDCNVVRWRNLQFSICNGSTHRYRDTVESAASVAVQFALS